MTVVILGHRLTAIALVLLVGAVWRLARLVITDQWPGWYAFRARVLRRWPPGPGRPTELLVCPWCVGVWIAAVVVTCWLLFPGVTLAVSLVLTVSAVAALVTTWTD